MGTGSRHVIARRRSQWHMDGQHADISCIQTNQWCPTVYINLIFSPQVYVGMVMDATCNCIPEGEVRQNDRSSLLNCQQYQFSAQGTIDATILTRGECRFDRYQKYLFGGMNECPELESALLTSGTTIFNGSKFLCMGVVSSMCRTSDNASYYSYHMMCSDRQAKKMLKGLPQVVSLWR
jgi:hypothetical protein